MKQQGLIFENAHVHCLLYGNEGRRFYFYILEGGVSDLYHCRHLVSNEVSTETDRLAFNVVVCCYRRAEELCEGMNDLHLVGFFIHDHE